MTHGKSNKTDRGGEGNGHSWLTAKDVLKIREARKGLTRVRVLKTDPRSYFSLSRHFGISLGAIAKIVYRRTWGHIA